MHEENQITCIRRKFRTSPWVFSLSMKCSCYYLSSDFIKVCYHCLLILPTEFFTCVIFYPLQKESSFFLVCCRLLELEILIEGCPSISDLDGFLSCPPKEFFFNNELNRSSFPEHFFLKKYKKPDSWGWLPFESDFFTKYEFV